jgi:L-fuculose-phosphate aldolase
VPTARGGDAATRREIVAACRKLYERGLISGAEGNVSARGRRRRGAGRPSTELAVHLRIYRRRADIHAVVHAHPPVATGLAVAGETFDAPVMPEVVLGLGPVALVPYATPGTEALADQLEAVVGGHDVFLLSNHGATVGPSLAVAYDRMESLEHSARILLAARLFGRVPTLTAQQVRDLVAARDEAGRPGPYGGGTPPGDGLETE